MVDYKNEFPLPFNELPETLQKLLTIESLDSSTKQIAVSTRFSKNQYQDNYEYLHMMMVCVPESHLKDLTTLDVSDSDGVVRYSTPRCEEKGGLYPISLKASGYDYIVASWGNGAHYSFSLAEKVWMTLGLSPRAHGNEEQKITYDDLSKPVLGVAMGDIATEHYYDLQKSVHWTIRNDYLRKYLWMIGCYGVRSFYYKAYIEDSPAVRALLAGQDFYNSTIGNGWADICLRENQGRLLLQVHASVIAVTPDLCAEQDINGFVWPDDVAPLSQIDATSVFNEKYIYVDDRFLEKYEKNKIYDAVPFKIDNQYSSCPSYKGKWAFNSCRRIGRNLLRLSLYELYKGVPVQEIQHVNKFAIPESEAIAKGMEGEHIVEKSERLLNSLILLGENLSELLKITTGSEISPVDILTFDRESYTNEGFGDFPIFQRLAQVAPWEMYEQDFLARCKTLNEVINRIKSGCLKKVLIGLGVENTQIKDLKILKLLQALLNVTQYFNEQCESIQTLPKLDESVNIKAENVSLATLFITNDLRNAESHESIEEHLKHLERGGFEISSVSDGYGNALDFILDGVNTSFDEINSNIRILLDRN